MVLLYMLVLPLLTSPLAMPTCCAAILVPFASMSAGDDTIVSGDVVVSGGELDAIVHGADHLVVVDAVKSRGLLRAVFGACPRS